VFQFPYEPPAEYDFRIVFTRETGNVNVQQILTARGHDFVWNTVMQTKNAGFDKVAGAYPAAKPAMALLPGLPVFNKRCESLVEVRRDLVTGYLDGKKMVEWKTDYSDMSLNPQHALHAPHRLGVSTWSNIVLFHDISVREITGKGKLLR
jgi:hypothetical protein